MFPPVRAHTCFCLIPVSAHMKGNQLMFLSHINISFPLSLYLSLSLSPRLPSSPLPPSSLSKINKKNENQGGKNSKKGSSTISRGNDGRHKGRISNSRCFLEPHICSYPQMNFHGLISFYMLTSLVSLFWGGGGYLLDFKIHRGLQYVTCEMKS